LAGHWLVLENLHAIKPGTRAGANGALTSRAAHPGVRDKQGRGGDISGSDSDSDYSNGSCSDAAGHDAERAARKIHLLLSEISAAPQMARQHRDGQSGLEKMLRSTYTN
jgi:hypothetical protein